MRKEKNVQMLVIVLLAVAVVAMSIGFAGYSQILNIGGGPEGSGATVNVKPTSWKIHFLETTYKEKTGTGYVASTSHTVGETDVTFETNLVKPGDTFEFEIDIKNDGNFDANLKNITMTALTAAQAKFLSYKINYDGTDYTQSTPNISNSTLNVGVTKKATVTVKYLQPASEADLPQTETPVSLTASFGFEQAE